MWSTRVLLTLGELRTTTGLAQADFLTLDFTGVTSDVTGGAEGRTEVFVVSHQGTSDAVTDSAGLSRTTTTSNSDVDVELFGSFGQLERLGLNCCSRIIASVNVLEIMAELKTKTLNNKN